MVSYSGIASCLILYMNKDCNSTSMYSPSKMLCFLNKMLHASCQDYTVHELCIDKFL